jgi:hypothetical protein
VKRYRGPDGLERLWFEPAEIESMMAAELARAGLMPTAGAPVVDIDAFIERHLCARLDQYADLEPEVLGLTEFLIGQRPKVSINRELTGSALDEEEQMLGTVGRWRATLAHEAAHVLLHRSLYELPAGQLGLFASEPVQMPASALMRCLKRDVSFADGRPYDWREVQANRGMAALLMPRSLVGAVARCLLAREDQDTLVMGLPREGSPQFAALATEISKRFEVSRQAARIRLQTLGLAAAREQRGLEASF